MGHQAEPTVQARINCSTKHSQQRRRGREQKIRNFLRGVLLVEATQGASPI
uniref:Uncharacterized protein n=1 Tax=Arundo donax TaxID=35708 RepID=A0A0A9FKI6_ARUDO